MVDDGEFELEKNKKPKALRLEFVSKGLVIAGDIAGPAPAAPPSAQLLQDAIQDAIEQEMKKYDDLRAGSQEGGTGRAINFGNPLDKTENKNRYTFWQEFAELLPLHAFSAEMVLGGMLAAMENERFHSGAAYVMNKLRSSMTVETLYRLSLCKLYLTKAIDEKLRNARDALDIMDIADEIFDAE